MPGVKMVEALAQCGAVAVLSQPENRGQLALFAGIDDVRFKRIVRPGEVLDARVRGRGGARPGRQGQGAGDGRRRARRARHAHLRGGRPNVIGRTTGTPVSITGLGCYVPERVVTNDELASSSTPPTSGSSTRTGIRERRIAADDEAMSDLALPGRPAGARTWPASTPRDDRPDHRRDRHAGHGVSRRPRRSLADTLGMPDAAAYDLSAGCTGFMYAIAQAYAMVAAGLAQRALVVGGDVLSQILDWTDRSTLVLFGDGAGAVVLEHVDEGGFLGFELGADGAGGAELWLPGSGSRLVRGRRREFLKMNGREVFKFATRVMVSSAEALLAECGQDGR